ncbi:MAG TPA: hypothetical protein VGM27_24605, partial [Acidobacteriaceae bacterium]
PGTFNICLSMHSATGSAQTFLSAGRIASRAKTDCCVRTPTQAYVRSRSGSETVIVTDEQTHDC